MASPAFVEAGTALNVNGSGAPKTGDVSVPSGATDGRFLLLIIRTSRADSTPTPPAGWTSITSHALTSATQTDMQLYYRVASSEPSTYTISNTGNAATNNSFTAQILVYEAATFETSATYAATSGSTTIPCPAVTSGGADRTLICVYGCYGNGTTGITYTQPSGMTERVDRDFVDGATGSSYGVADLAVSSSGSTGTKNATASSSLPWHLAVSVLIQSSGGGGYTITCAQGSYTLTGQAAGTKVGRKLAAAQGTYTLIGSAASLIEGHVLTCAQGSYTLTGSTAYADYAITCASGSYTLSGQAAGTNAARKLAAAQGSYTLTGQDVALLYTTPGAYSLAMGQGTYTLTGQAAALQAARRIVAEQGLYALSGQAAALRLGRKVALAVGSYSLTGQDIAFDAPARLAAAAGSYALTGQAVTLTYAGAPVAAVLSAPPSGRRLQGYGRPANIQRSIR